MDAGDNRGGADDRTAAGDSGQTHALRRTAATIADVTEPIAGGMALERSPPCSMRRSLSDTSPAGSGPDEKPDVPSLELKSTPGRRNPRRHLALSAPSQESCKSHVTAAGWSVTRSAGLVAAAFDRVQMLRVAGLFCC